MRRKTLAAFVLAVSLVFQAGLCSGGSFATSLRLTLAASGPLLDSLVASGAISANIRAGLITDFSDLANGAATLKEDLDQCADSKPCKLDAVEKFHNLFTAISARGRFGAHARIQQISIIVRGIISAARIYYGGSPLPGEGVTGGPLPSQSEAKKMIEAKLKELDAAMKVTP